LLAVPNRGGLAADPWAAAGWFLDRAPPDPPGPAPHAPADLIDEMLSGSLGATSLLLEDRAAAAAGLDNRQPYLAAELVAFARGLPLSHAMSPEGRTKEVLRRALRGLVPDAILDREDRVGFAVPAVGWLLQGRPWAEARYRELRSLPFFAGPPADAVWAELAGGGSRAWSTAYRAWRWIVLLEWATARQARFE